MLTLTTCANPKCRAEFLADGMFITCEKCRKYDNDDHSGCRRIDAEYDPIGTLYRKRPDGKITRVGRYSAIRTKERD